MIIMKNTKSSIMNVSYSLLKYADENSGHHVVTDGNGSSFVLDE